MTKEEFAQTIKQKYPQYQNINDTELADKILAKYPQYNSKITDTIQIEQKKSPIETSNVVGINTGITPNQAVGVAKDVAGAYSKSVSNAFNSSVDQAKTGYNEAKTAAESGFSGSNLLKLLEGSVKMGAGVVGSVFSPLAPVSDVIGAGVNTVSKPISNIPAVQNFATSKAGENTIRATEDISNLNTLVGGVAGGMEVAPKIIPTAKNLINKTVDLTTNTIDKMKAPSTLDESKVLDTYNRAIKPTVVGKSNAGQIAKANDNVLSGIKTIADNKANLSLTDSNGEVIKGQSPKSVDQFTQAIEQTKKSIFQQYDALAKQAGKEGVKVDTTAIASELSPVIDSKSLSIANPNAIKYAEALQKRLIDTGSLDATTAQEVIQHYNETLKAFYKNPSYETASNVQIDALIANKFREALDNGITGLTGKEYGALKKQYGALSSIEKDVAHRNVVWGRQNGIGLTSNLANITSGAELIKGLVTMNPTDIAVSMGIKGIQKYMKYLNNPDVGVSKLFSEIEKPSLPSKGNKQAQVKSNK